MSLLGDFFGGAADVLGSAERGLGSLGSAALSGLGSLGSALATPQGALLGLGALGTGGAVLSAINQAQQQNRIRGQAQNIAGTLTNPQAMTAQAQQYYNANLPAVQQAAQGLLQQQIAPIEGERGFDPRSGQGQLIYDQAVYPLFQQAYQNAVRNAIGAQEGALGGLNTASYVVNPFYGAGGGVGSALQSLMLMRLLQNPTAAVVPGSPALASTPAVSPNDIFADEPELGSGLQAEDIG